MRTTLTLDPDVARRLRDRLADRNTTLKQVVNDALRRGLAAEPQSKPRRRFRVIPHSFGFRPGIDVYKLNQLADELEAQAFVAKARPAKRRQ